MTAHQLRAALLLLFFLSTTHAQAPPSTGSAPLPIPTNLTAQMNDPRTPSGALGWGAGGPGHGGGGGWAHGGGSASGGGAGTAKGGTGGGSGASAGARGGSHACTTGACAGGTAHGAAVADGNVTKQAASAFGFGSGTPGKGGGGGIGVSGGAGAGAGGGDTFGGAGGGAAAGPGAASVGDGKTNTTFGFGAVAGAGHGKPIPSMQVNVPVEERDDGPPPGIDVRGDTGSAGFVGDQGMIGRSGGVPVVPVDVQATAVPLPLAAQGGGVQAVSAASDATEKLSPTKTAKPIVTAPPIAANTAPPIAASKPTNNVTLPTAHASTDGALQPAAAVSTGGAAQSAGSKKVVSVTAIPVPLRKADAAPTAVAVPIDTAEPTAVPASRSVSDDNLPKELLITVPTTRRTMVIDPNNSEVQHMRLARNELLPHVAVVPSSRQCSGTCCIDRVGCGYKCALTLEEGRNVRVCAARICDYESCGTSSRTLVRATVLRNVRITR